ncbi:TfoX/Sxy family protein [Salinibius halmophilus]|uniref:TfoX/Sxy family protein n=1 Tax=Salinibius halmophilus TaxID=1853216 RepID=UPI000E66D9C3|nr:TfoX/Sxy family protein [Salinibius halmophilus]
MTQQLAQLANLGPKSAQMLVDAGIKTEAQLRQVGAIAAYAQVKQQHQNASLNLLWALEGVLQNKPWQDIAKHQRQELILALDAYYELQKMDSNNKD